MFSLKQVFFDTRLTKAVIGMDKNRFDSLLESFEIALARDEKKRKLHPTKGIDHTLRTPREKLFFILFYLKCYPTLDLTGLFFDVNRSQPCRWVKLLLPIMEEALGIKDLLPKRKARTLEELFERCPELKEVWVDGTDRPVRRPKNSKEQKAKYSGKKKRHTVKNVIVSTRDRRIVYLSPTCPGKEHDLKILRDEQIPKAFPSMITAFMDTGFLGIKKDYPDLNIKMPERKPHKKPMPSSMKKSNRAISSVRILVEHSIGGAKRLDILRNIFRNVREGMADQVMLVGCGIWNMNAVAT